MIIHNMLLGVSVKDALATAAHSDLRDARGSRYPHSRHKVLPCSRRVKGSGVGAVYPTKRVSGLAGGLRERGNRRLHA
jgi:hypothetical protein